MTGVQTCALPISRYSLYDKMREFMQKAESSHSKMGVFMLDVDDFKSINDTYGHLVGDEALKKISEILKKNVRDKDFVIRYAGDEFIILLGEIDVNLAKIIGGRIIKEAGKFLLRKEGKKIKITVSGGLAIYPQDGAEPEELIERADQALYFSKDRGKNKLSLAYEIGRAHV